jgi:hypothetical protein
MELSPMERQRLIAFLKSFHFKRELDATDLLKTVVAVLIAAYAYFTVQSAKTRAEVIPKVRPNLETHYTNAVSSDGKTLLVKVYAKVLASNSVTIGPPLIFFVPAQGEKQLIPNHDALKSRRVFFGSFSPQSAYHVEYKIPLPKYFDPQTKIRFEYLASTDREVVEAFKSALLPFAGRDQVENASTKAYIYEEEIYQFGTNKLFETFDAAPQ